MKIAFRLEYSKHTGGGHFVRCLNLAKSLTLKGMKCLFIMEEIPRSAILPLNEASVEHILLTGSNQTICNDFKKLHPDCDFIIIDHYNFKETDFSTIKAKNLFKYIIVIDDLIDRFFDCDLLINQNYEPHAASKYKELVSKDTKLLLGPSYAILNPSFTKYRNTLDRKKDNSSIKVLISFGLSDPVNETEKVLMACNEVESEQYSFHVIIGSLFQNIENLEKFAKINSHITFVKSPDNMAELICYSDFAIGGGGVMTWERACLGLPTIAISIAENQIIPTKLLGDDGYLHYLGNFDKVSKENIVNAIQTFGSDLKLRQNYSENSLSLTTGEGVDIIATEILNLQKESK